MPLEWCNTRAMYLVTHGVLVAELAIDNIGEDFSIAVRMCAKASVRLHQVVVQHLQQANKASSERPWPTTLDAKSPAFAQW